MSLATSHQNDVAPFTSVVAITAHDSNQVASGRQFNVVCTVAGNVKVTLDDGSTFTFPVAVGLSVFPWAVKQVFVTGTTATATYSNMS